MTDQWLDAGAVTSGGGLEWGDGYVVDTPYFEPAGTDLCPAWLSMVAVLRGQPPLDLSRPLTWMDLGAASGISACMVGAANPDIDVWGFDHNPGHVERARTLADKALLANCHFQEASFADLAADRHLGPPEADVIVVSGVYSWISRANQLRIADVVRQRLKPGGLAYVMYETSPGWSSMVPLAEALRLLAQADGRRGDLAFHDAAETLLALARAGARYFPIGAREQATTEGWATANGFYAAHEYLGAHFGPLLFDDVAEVMAGARLSYLGQLDPLDHLPGFWAPPALVDRIASTPHVTTRELLRDLIGQRALRRDLYRRGLAVSTPPQHEADLHDLRAVGLGKPFAEEPVGVLGGGVALDPTYYEPLVGALQHQTLDVATIREIHTEWSVADAAGALAFLVAGGYAVPGAATPLTEAAVVASRRLTEVLIGENRRGADHGTVIAATLGSGLPVDALVLMALGEHWDGTPADPDLLADRVLADLARQDRSVKEEHRLVDDPDEARSVAVRRIADALPLLTRLGLAGG